MTQCSSNSLILPAFNTTEKTSMPNSLCEAISTTDPSNICDLLAAVSDYMGHMEEEADKTRDKLRKGDLGSIHLFGKNDFTVPPGAPKILRVHSGYYDPIVYLSTESAFTSFVSHYSLISGKWMYEVTLISDGILQIGWCVRMDMHSWNEVNGVGDFPFSVAYDGSRKQILNVANVPGGWRWVAGDTITCCFDLDEGIVTFYHNGSKVTDVSMPTVTTLHKEGVQYSNQDTHLAYFPAISLGPFEKCNVNFGAFEFMYPQKGYFPIDSTPRVIGPSWRESLETIINYPVKYNHFAPAVFSVLFQPLISDPETHGVTVVLQIVKIMTELASGQFPFSQYTKEERNKKIKEVLVCVHDSVPSEIFSLSILPAVMSTLSFFASVRPIHKTMLLRAKRHESEQIEVEVQECSSSNVVTSPHYDETLRPTAELHVIEVLLSIPWVIDIWARSHSWRLDIANIVRIKMPNSNDLAIMFPDVYLLDSDTLNRRELGAIQHEIADKWIIPDDKKRFAIFKYMMSDEATQIGIVELLDSTIKEITEKERHLSGRISTRIFDCDSATRFFFAVSNVIAERVHGRLSRDDEFSKEHKGGDIFYYTGTGNIWDKYGDQLCPVVSERHLSDREIASLICPLPALRQDADYSSQRGGSNCLGGRYDYVSRMFTVDFNEARFRKGESSELKKSRDKSSDHSEGEMDRIPHDHISNSGISRSTVVRHYDASEAVEDSTSNISQVSRNLRSRIYNVRDLPNFSPRSGENAEAVKNAGRSARRLFSESSSFHVHEEGVAGSRLRLSCGYNNYYSPDILMKLICIFYDKSVKHYVIGACNQTSKKLLERERYSAAIAPGSQTPPEEVERIRSSLVNTTRHFAWTMASLFLTDKYDFLLAFCDAVTRMVNYYENTNYIYYIPVNFLGCITDLLHFCRKTSPKYGFYIRKYPDLVGFFFKYFRSMVLLQTDIREYVMLSIAGIMDVQECNRRAISLSISLNKKARNTFLKNFMPHLMDQFGNSTAWTLVVNALQRFNTGNAFCACEEEDEAEWAQLFGTSSNIPPENAEAFKVYTQLFLQYITHPKYWERNALEDAASSEAFFRNLITHSNWCISELSAALANTSTTEGLSREVLQQRRRTACIYDFTKKIMYVLEFIIGCCFEHYYGGVEVSSRKECDNLLESPGSHLSDESPHLWKRTPVRSPSSNGGNYSESNKSSPKYKDDTSSSDTDDIDPFRSINGFFSASRIAQSSINPSTSPSSTIQHRASMRRLNVANLGNRVKALFPVKSVQIGTSTKIAMTATLLSQALSRFSKLDTHLVRVHSAELTGLDRNRIDQTRLLAPVVGCLINVALRGTTPLFGSYNFDVSNSQPPAQVKISHVLDEYISIMEKETTAGNFKEIEKEWIEKQINENPILEYLSNVRNEWYHEGFVYATDGVAFPWTELCATYRGNPNRLKALEMTIKLFNAVDQERQYRKRQQKVLRHNQHNTGSTTVAMGGTTIPEEIERDAGDIATLQETNKGKTDVSFVTGVSQLNREDGSRKGSDISKSDDSYSGDDEDLCSICYTVPVDVIFLPCQHQSCESCIIRHQVSDNRCFFCKKPIEKTSHITVGMRTSKKATHDEIL